MPTHNIGRALNSPPDTYDDSERVAARIAELSYAELRELCEVSRSPYRFISKRCPGQRFSDWLRERVSAELAEEDRSYE